MTSLLWHWEGSADALRDVGDSVAAVVDDTTYVAARGTCVGHCDESTGFEMDGEVAENGVGLFDGGCEDGRGQEGECANDGVEKHLDLCLRNDWPGYIRANSLIVWTGR